MTLLLIFAAVLLLAVLLSALAHRTVLSTAVVFLVAGFLVGDGMSGVVHVTAQSPVVSSLAELALFAVLFTDGMRVGWADLRAAWKLPGRALGLGLPLTLLVTAVLAHYVAGLGWVESLLIGAILAPTDPVFAAALVGNEKVPARLRHLLNVESGVNDGLALPFVVILLAVVARDDLHLVSIGWELLLGIAIGIAVPWIAIRLERTRWFAVSGQYAPLNAVAIGLLVLALSKVGHANLFLAAFAAGITVATIGHKEREAFEHFGELVAEIFKLAALLVFGALLSPAFFGGITWTGWAFAILALVVARPVALWLSFLRSRLGMREQLAAMWFGPKGFASVVYGLLVLASGVPAAGQIFALSAFTIVLSIVLHSSSDVIVARGFDPQLMPAWQQRLEQRGRRILRMSDPEPDTETGD